MERVTISMSQGAVAELAEFMASHRYDNRSEAIRDLARRGLEQARGEAGQERRGWAAQPWKRVTTTPANWRSG